MNSFIKFSMENINEARNLDVIFQLKEIKGLYMFIIIFLKEVYY